MKSYRVVYLENGRRVTRKIIGSDAEDIRSNIVMDGGIIIQIKPQHIRSSKPFALNLFIQELVALLDAGLVVTEAIEALHSSQNTPQTAEIYPLLLKKLREGNSLSRAMSALPGIFPPLLVNTVASSEQTGHLAAALKRYQHYDQRMILLRRRIRSILLYPTIVISAGGAILFFLLGFVLPRFAAVFDGMKNPSGSARFILWWGKLVEQQGLMLLISTLLAVAGLVYLIRHPVVRQKLLHVTQHLPGVREQYLLMVLVRFYRTLGLLLQGGMVVPQALGLTRAILPAEYHPRLGGVLEQVNGGRALSQALDMHQLTTPIAFRLLVAGEESGELPTMCEHIAAFYDDALERAIELFSKVFEPMLMMVIGGIVGLVVFLLYMPIFELAGGLS